MSNQNPRLQVARDLIEEKKYEEARALLATMPHDPTAVKWLAKLNERIGQSGSIQRQSAPANRNYTVLPASRARVYPEPGIEGVESIGAARIFRWVWGVLTLLSIGWLCYGITSTFSIAGSQMNNLPERNQDAAAVGTFLGSSIGIGFFLCTGLPFLLLFGILYWRNGVAIRETKKHNQTIEALYRQRR